MTQILRYALNMLPAMLIALPIILLVRFHIKAGVKVNKLHEAGCIAFGLYLVGVASQAIIPKLVFGGSGVSIVGGGIDPGRINLIPLNKVPETWQMAIQGGQIDYFVIEVLGNIGIFIVIGFMLPLLWERFERLRNTILICFLISLFIEVVQLVLPRATDVDDLIMNVLGGLAGYLVYTAFNRALPGAADKFKNSVAERRR